jgi:hypothetical protein
MQTPEELHGVIPETRRGQVPRLSSTCRSRHYAQAKTRSVFTERAARLDDGLRSEPDREKKLLPADRRATGWVRARAVNLLIRRSHG